MSLEPVRKDIQIEGSALLGQAKFIISAYGLNALKPKLYGFDQDKIIDDEIEQENQKEGTSRFGTPIFDTLTFSGDNPDNNKLSYTTLQGEEIVLDPLKMIVVLLTVNQAKNIVKTPVQGRDGTVKEYISLGDFMINIKGVLSSDAIDVEPTDEKEQLIKYCAAPIEIACSSRYLQSFGINSLVIENYKLEQIKGTRNLVKYELNCSSDLPFENVFSSGTAL